MEEMIAFYTDFTQLKQESKV